MRKGSSDMNRTNNITNSDFKKLLKVSGLNFNISNSELFVRKNYCFFFFFNTL